MTCTLRRLLPGRKTYDDAHAELEDARAELARVRRQWPDVLRYAAALTAHRERNHFAESINTIFRGGKS